MSTLGKDLIPGDYINTEQSRAPYEVEVERVRILAVEAHDYGEITVTYEWLAGNTNYPPGHKLVANLGPESIWRLDLAIPKELVIEEWL